MSQLIWISWGMLTGRPMSEDKARAFMSANAGSPGFRRVLGGQAGGITTPEGTATFREIKDGLRSGAWLHDARLRAFCLGAAGVLLLALGGFGYFIVSGPPAVKLMCAGVLLYAFGRTAWAFWRA